MLAEEVERLSFTVHELNQHLTDINDSVERLNETLNQFKRLNSDKPKQKHSTRPSRLFRYKFSIEVLSLVYNLIEKIAEVIKYFI